MHDRTKASLLWGVVGVLSLLVLVGGYRLAAGPSFAPSMPLVAAAGVAAGVLAAVGSYVLDRLLVGGE